MFTRRFTSKNERGENALLLVQWHFESPETWEIASNSEYMTVPGSRIGAVEITGTAIDCFAELESAKGGWISVNDRLPPKVGAYLVCESDGNIETADYHAAENTAGDFYRYFHGQIDLIADVAYWQPLPASPSD